MDGNTIAANIRKDIKERVGGMVAENRQPCLAVILVGDNPASCSYVRAKERDCTEVGIRSHDIHLSKDSTQTKLLELINRLNNDESVHAILVQLPLPDHIDEETIINSISPEKDVDGFHPENIGRLVLNKKGIIPCTPLGVMRILETEGIQIEGADIVIIGRSRIVGAPLANLLFRKARGGNATVTVCHTRTKKLAEKVRRSDIVIAAAGRPDTVRADMVKDGAIVVDVGVNRVEDPSCRRGYRLIGDVDFENVKEVAGAITPVPGGVGPLTRAMLLQNTVDIASQVDYTEGNRRGSCPVVY